MQRPKDLPRHIRVFRIGWKLFDEGILDFQVLQCAQIKGSCLNLQRKPQTVGRSYHYVEHAQFKRLILGWLSITINPATGVGLSTHDSSGGIRAKGRTPMRTNRRSSVL